MNRTEATYTNSTSTFFRAAIDLRLGVEVADVPGGGGELIDSRPASSPVPLPLQMLPFCLPSGMSPFISVVGEISIVGTGLRAEILPLGIEPFTGIMSSREV